MKTMPIAEVKAHFSGLARQVERGATVIVTRHGKPILEIRPARASTAAEAIAGIRAFRASDGFNRQAPALRKGETPRGYAHRDHKR